MTDNNLLDDAYQAGSRAVWLSLLRQCMEELEYGVNEAGPLRWIVEREEAIATLRRCCGDHGDNKWDERLHLADIIDKHLCRYLDEE